MMLNIYSHNMIDKYNTVFVLNKYYQHKDNFLNNLVNTNPYDREIMTLYKNKNIDNTINNINTTNTTNTTNTNTTNTSDNIDNIWYAYKGDWLIINNNKIKAKKNVFIKKNQDIHTDKLDNNSKKMIDAETIFDLTINQNNNKYFIIKL